MPSTPKPLTPEQFPYTGPYGLPASDARSQGPTAVALKEAMWRMGLFHKPPFDDHYNEQLAGALARWDPGHAGYGTGRWTKIRAAVVPSGPNKGELALDALAVKLVRDEHATHLVTLVYPHPAHTLSTVCQELHPTEGIPGNWAYDFCAPGDTPVLADFAGVVTKLSGHDPASGTHGPAGDIFGWSTYYVRGDGVEAYVTHQGARFVHVGQRVNLGQMIGKVGWWPHNAGRSHSHVGVSSPHGTADAKRIITAVAHAPRVDM